MKIRKEIFTALFFFISSNSIFSQLNYQICTGYITDTYGSIIDDGDTNSNYLNNVNCDLVILPYCSDTITLWFTKFNTEAGHDSLSVYDGIDSLAPLIWTHSGNTIPPIIKTTSGALFLRWNSDSAIADSGFVAHWTSNNISCFPLPIIPCCQAGISRVQFIDDASSNIIFDNNNSVYIYHDFSCSDSLTLYSNTLYGYTILTGFGYPEKTVGWIDFNEDLNFDSTELFFGDSALTNHVGTFSIDSTLIPSQVFGKKVRMRLMSDQLSASISPCTGPLNGNTEDYLVGIEKFISNDIKEIKQSKNLYFHSNVVNHEFQFEYKLENKSKVTLDIFDINGKLISSILKNEIQNPGFYNDVADFFNSGVFIVKFQVDNQTYRKKLISFR